MENAVRKEWALALATMAAWGFLQKRPGAALALSACAAGMALLSSRNKDSLEGQSVVITGGSRGLGLALAMECAQRGARLALLARDEEELREAERRIQARVPGVNVFGIPCDVTDPKEVSVALARVAKAHAGIDLLVNNAGAITVGPWDTFGRSDYAAQMELHFFAVLEACRLALPYLRSARGRRIVNICSLGGRRAVPHMLPYNASKFALAGFSQGLRAELASEGISVTTVYPSVMRTGSPIQATFKGDHESEFSWFATTDLMPGLSRGAASCARLIVEGALERRAEVLTTPGLRFALAAGTFFPETTALLLGFVARLLPKNKNPELRTGFSSRTRFDRSRWRAPLRWMGRRAEQHWNQRPRHSAELN